ncbi:hypothetical protein BC332_03141 [Capsicum chinense]|nr:hypothetical protein BC332_03141 [Capsicum chinense]
MSALEVRDAVMMRNSPKNDMVDPVWDVAILRDSMRQLQKEVHDLHWELAAVRPPLNSYVSAGNGPLFRSLLPGYPVTVTITDECPSCSGAVHFDLKGTSMGAMAKPGQANALRNLRNIAISYQRVPCQYRNTKIAFKVAPGSNPNFLSVNVQFQSGDGDLNLVDFLPSRSTKSIIANHVFGAT